MENNLQLQKYSFIYIQIYIYYYTSKLNLDCVDFTWENVIIIGGNYC